MKLIIEDEEGRKTVVPFVREEISIGRQEGNTIRLTERNVSRKHARLLRKNGSVLVEDLGSFNGVKVNGDRIEGKLPVQEGDLIEIGDYDLAIENEAADGPQQAGGQAREDGRANTEPSDADGRAPTAVSGRATTAPARPSELPGDEEAGDASPPRSQSTAVIRTGALNSQAREVRDLAPEERPKVVIVTSDQAGQEAVLEKSEFRIGRTTGDNDLAINHRSISRNHAKIVLDADGTWHVLDLQSANGVRVNGEDYADAPIASGDLVELGHVKLRFVGAGESYHYAPEDERTPTRRSSSGRAPEQMKLYGMVGGGVAIVAVCIGLYFALGNKSSLPPKLDRHPSLPIAENTSPTHPALPPPPTPSAAANPPAAAAPTAAPVAPPPEEPVEKPRPARHQAPKEPKPERKSHKVAATAPTGEASDEGEDSGAKADKHAKAVQTVQEAVGLMNSSDYRGAAVKLQRALALDPNMADAHKALGICYAKLQEPDKGAAHYEQYIKLKPNAPDAARVKEMLKAYYQSRGQ